MFTQEDRDRMAAEGSRTRHQALLEQATFLVELARREGAQLVALLPSGFLADAEKLVSEVRSIDERRIVVAETAREATRAQDRALLAALRWRRRAARLAALARASGAAVPADLARVGTLSVSVQAAMAAIGQALPLLTESRAALSKYASYGSLVKEGLELESTLPALDTAQETARRKELREAVRKVHELRGELRAALRLIVRAGRSLHAGDAAASKPYGFAIYYRRSPRLRDAGAAASAAQARGRPPASEAAKSPAA